MIPKLVKNETMNVVLFVLLIFIFMPLIKSIVALLTTLLGGATSLTRSLNDTFISPITSSLPSMSTSNPNSDTDEAKGHQIAIELHKILISDSIISFSRLRVNVDESALIQTLNKCTTKKLAQWMIIKYYTLYGYNLHADVLECLSSNEFNQIFVFIRTELQKLPSRNG